MGHYCADRDGISGLPVDISPVESLIFGGERRFSHSESPAVGIFYQEELQRLTVIIRINSSPVIARKSAGKLEND